MLIAFGGALGGLWTIYLKLFLGKDLSNSMWLMLSFFLVFMGFQFFISGIMLDIIIKDYFNTSFEKRYNVREIVGKRKR